MTPSSPERTPLPVEKSHRYTTVGARLRLRREKLRLRVDDVSRETRIPKRSLLALERDDFDSISGAFYVRGFLRVYASHLGLDALQVLEAYEAQVQPELDPAVASDDVPSYFRSQQGPSRTLSPMQLLLLFVTAATLVVFMLSMSRNRGADNVASRPTVAGSESPATAKIRATESGAVVPVSAAVDAGRN
jgi:cytoskeletal protein RodZ